MKITADLKGLKDFEQRLAAIGEDAATKAGQAANRAGAMLVAKEVRRIAPNSPKTTEGEKRKRHNKGGTTREETHHKIVNSVRVKKRKPTDPHTVQNAVTIVGAYHANFVQFGSIHNAVDPFLTDALENVQQPVIDAVAKMLEKRLTKLGA